MKRIMTLIAAVTLSLSVMAQRTDYNNFVGLNLGGGINTMTYDPQGGDYRLGFGGDVGLHFTHFFGDHFGMGLGAYFGWANAKAVYNYSETLTGLSHPHNGGAKYDLTTQYNDWEEHQSLRLLSIPVEFFWRAPMCSNWTFIAGLGASLDLPLNGTIKADDGSYTTTGYFPALGYSVANLPTHGFGTYDADREEDLDGLKMGVSVIADLGFRLALKNHWGLYLGLYGGYGLTNMREDQDAMPMVAVNASNPGQHDYNGSIVSTHIDGVHLLRCGVKIGIDLGWTCHDNKAEALAAAEAARMAREKAVADSIEAVRAEALRAAREIADKEARARAEAEARAAAEKAERERAALVQARLDSIAAAQALMPAKPVTRQEMQKRLDDINATVYFETSGTTPKFDEKTDAIIRTLCASMMADDKLKAEITGHTDNKGSAAVNMKYGQKRAEALKKYMISLGAPADNIETKSRGMEQPIVPNDSDANRAKNRRATVVLK